MSAGRRKSCEQPWSRCQMSCVFTPHPAPDSVHVGATPQKQKSHPQEPTLTDTWDIWSFAQCIKQPCDTGQCQRPPKQRSTTAQFRAAFANPFLCAINRDLGQSQPLAICVSTSVSECSGHKPRPCLQPSSSGPAIQASVSPQ